MSQYPNENDHIVDDATGRPLDRRLIDPEEEIISNERRRVSLWGVIGAGVLVILIAAASFMIWPSPATSPTSTASTTQDPINAQPSGAGTFDNNPATGSIKPPEATDRSPSPSGNGGGPTGVTSPSGTEKVQ